MAPCRKLDPDLALKVPWTRQEDEQLLHLQAVHDNHWAEMAKHLRGRNAQMCRTRCVLCPHTVCCLISLHSSVKPSTAMISHGQGNTLGTTLDVCMYFKCP